MAACICIGNWSLRRLPGAPLWAFNRFLGEEQHLLSNCLQLGVLSFLLMTVIHTNLHLFCSNEQDIKHLISLRLPVSMAINKIKINNNGRRGADVWRGTDQRFIVECKQKCGGIMPVWICRFWQLHAPKESCSVPFSNIATDLYANIVENIPTAMFEAFFERLKKNLCYRPLGC